MSQYADDMYPIDGAAGEVIAAKSGQHFIVSGGLIQPQDDTVGTLTIKDGSTAKTGPINLDQSGAAGVPFLILNRGMKFSSLVLEGAGLGDLTGYIQGHYEPNAFA